MSNRFLGVLKTIGKDCWKVFTVAEPYAEKAIGTFFPLASPLFNLTAHAVMTAEANAAAIGKSSGTGPQKAAAVVGLIGELIKVGLQDVGKANDQAAVQKYIDSVVTILNSTPHPQELEQKAPYTIVPGPGGGKIG